MTKVSCTRGAKCSFKHCDQKRKETVTRDSEHQVRRSVDSLLRNQRPASAQETSPSGRDDRFLCFNYKKGQCLTDTNYDYWRLPFYISQKKCRAGYACLFLHLSKDHRSPNPQKKIKRRQSQRLKRGRHTRKQEVTFCTALRPVTFNNLARGSSKRQKARGSLVGSRQPERFFKKRILFPMSQANADYLWVLSLGRTVR